MMEFIDRHEAAIMLARHGFENMSEDSVQGDEWRRYGKIRRLELLKRDREEGENLFEINPSVRIDKYFQVINRSLDQFHELYKDKKNCNLEEVYVMGHRIQRFLTEFVTEHPEYVRPRSWHLRNQSRRDVRTLQFCLEDIAVLIDEKLCNELVDYAPEFDGLLLQEEGGTSLCKPSGNPEQLSSLNNWDTFGGWGNRKKDDRYDESLGSTINTSASDFVDNLDPSYDDFGPLSENYSVNNENEARDGTQSMVKSARIIFPLSLSESAEDDHFLSVIANQKFSFELDSDACDSWAQDRTLRNQKVEQCMDTTATTTCDPAEIMFRHILSTGCARMRSGNGRFERDEVKSYVGSKLGSDVFCEGRDNKIARIGAKLDGGVLNEDIFNQSAYHLRVCSQVDKEHAQHLNEVRNSNSTNSYDHSPPHGNQTNVRFEDHYLVAEKESPQPEAIPSRGEEAQFPNFDFSLLTEDDWIDFGGDTSIDAF